MPRTPSTAHIDSAIAVGRRIRQTRTEKGLSQKDLAFSGCTPAYLSRVENGQRNPSLQIIERLAAQLDVTTAWLAKGEEAAQADFHRSAARHASEKGAIVTLELYGFSDDRKILEEMLQGITLIDRLEISPVDRLLDLANALTKAGYAGEGKHDARLEIGVGDERLTLNIAVGWTCGLKEEDVEPFLVSALNEIGPALFHRLYAIDLQNAVDRVLQDLKAFQAERQQERQEADRQIQEAISQLEGS